MLNTDNFTVRKTFFLYLIIYVFFSSLIHSQNLLLKIEGETERETTLIDSITYKKIHLDYASIKNEVLSLQNTVLKNGYIENDFKGINKINDTVFLASLHLKKKYQKLSIYYDTSILDKKLLQLISKDIFKDHFIIDIKNTDDVLNFINAKISEKGYPFSRLYLSDITIKDNTNLEANLIVESNEQKRTINNIVIKGYEKFPRSFLKHYIKIKPSQTFNLDAIKKKSEKFRDLRFVTEAKAPEILFSKDSTTLYLYLNKTKSNSFDGFLGFGTNDKTNKLDFNGYLDLNLTNNLNYGESFKLLYKGEQNEQKLFETNLTLPYLFKSPIGLDLALRIFNKDSSFITVNQSAKIHYQINPNQKVSTGILSIQSNNLLNINTSSSIVDYKSNYFTLAYQFLKRQSQNTIFPIKTNVSIETNFGKRKQTSQTEQQSLIALDAYKIFNLDPKNSIFLRTQGTTLNSNTYLENELIRFGGINSLRGFEENSIYATLYGLINTEYRFLLNNNLYVHTLTDAAYLENKITATKQKLFGYGIGFGLFAKTGLFKLNYAIGHTENQDFNFSNYKIQISFISSF